MTQGNDDPTLAASIAGVDPLSSLTRVSRLEDARPVVVIGLPRSGSTFLTHVLNCFEDLFIFNDLYCLQEAQTLRCAGPLTTKQLTDLVDFLRWQARARIRLSPPLAKLPMTWDDVDILCATLLSLFSKSPVTWSEVMSEFLARIALFLGRRYWGYKTPQDFHHIELIATLFPNVRFVFLMRDPRDVLASYKFNKTFGADPGQYHPWAYSRYWKMAVTTAVATCSRLDLPLYLVRFEDMVRDPDSSAQGLAEFLGTSLARPISRLQPNTSFGSSDRKSPTPTEIWICQKTAGDTMDQHGYHHQSVRFDPRDLPDLARSTLRFLYYQVKRLRKERLARVKVAAFCRALLPQRRKDNNRRASNPGPR